MMNQAPSYQLQSIILQRYLRNKRPCKGSDHHIGLNHENIPQCQKTEPPIGGCDRYLQSKWPTTQGHFSQRSHQWRQALQIRDLHFCQGRTDQTQIAGFISLGSKWRLCVSLHGKFNLSCNLGSHGDAVLCVKLTLTKRKYTSERHCRCSGLWFKYFLWSITLLFCYSLHKTASYNPRYVLNITFLCHIPIID